jgi:hypothetical protein
MRMQKEMEETMLKAHRGFMKELANAIDTVEKELDQAEEMSSICTDEWCQATEHYLDDLHKSVYSISEPRFSSEADHEQIKKLRNRVKDLYLRFKTREAA